CALTLLLAVAPACSRSRNRERAAAAARAEEQSGNKAGKGEGRRAEAETPAAATLAPQPDFSDRTAVSGGVLKVHLEAEPPHLNPLQDGHQVIARVVNGLVYESLLEC